MSHPRLKVGRSRRLWENSHNENFNRSLEDKSLKEEIFHNLKEAEAAIENWGQEYSTVKPHSSLNDRPPAPETI